MPPKPFIQIGIFLKEFPQKNIGYLHAKIGIFSSSGLIQGKDFVETEVQKNLGEVKFDSRLRVEYTFEECQVLHAEIFSTNPDSKQDSILICSASSTVGRVIHSGGTLSCPLIWNTNYDKNSESDQNAFIVFCIREDPLLKENLYMKLEGKSLDKKDFFGKSDPYIAIYRRNDRKRLQRVYRTEVIKSTLDPDWKPILISLDRLCGGDFDSEIIFRCFDWDGAEGDIDLVDPELDDQIGEFVTTCRQLILASGRVLEFKLINSQKKRKKRSYSNSGLVKIRLFYSENSFSFLDYIIGGTSINIIVGIDLTSTCCGSLNSQNLPSYSSNSDSAANSIITSEYTIALNAVLEILQEYDSDQLFPAFGFGARFKNQKIYQKFPLNGNHENPYCKGASGVVKSYENLICEKKTASPKCFAPIIRYVNGLAKQTPDSSQYYVLLMLTDGTVDDWIETKKAVIESSYLPVSIIVIGVGGGKFFEMEILDQDFKLLSVGQDEACRDGVQFVHMRKFLRKAADGSDQLKWSKVALTKEVLAELPYQFMEYMKMKQFTPFAKLPGKPCEFEELVDSKWWHNMQIPCISSPSKEKHSFKSSRTTEASQTKKMSSPNISLNKDDVNAKFSQLFLSPKVDRRTRLNTPSPVNRQMSFDHNSYQPTDFGNVRPGNQRVNNKCQIKRVSSSIGSSSTSQKYENFFPM